MKNYVRPSLLDTSFFCGLAARLADVSGAGRAAVKGTAFHALCAGEPGALDMLTAEEREDVESWKKPTPFDVDVDGKALTLAYEDAVREKRLAVDEDFQPCPEDDPFLLTAGTPDIVHLVALPDGRFLVYVEDIKKTEWTTMDGPDSLQVLTYGRMACAVYGADGFTTSLWIATDGEREFRQDGIIWVGSEECRRLEARIRYAARNISDEGTMGPHCKSCYARVGCPAYALPAVLSETKLRALAAGAEATDEELTEALLHAQELKDIGDAAVKEIQERVRRGADISGNGKRYLPSLCKGREGVTPKSLREAMGDEAEQYIRRGKPFEQFRWVKDRR